MTRRQGHLTNGDTGRAPPSELMKCIKQSWTIASFVDTCSAINVIAAVPAEDIADEYADKSTGSITAALVGLHFMHRVTKMLEQNAYVRCLMIDFSKAFDSVDHVVLLSKLAQLLVNLPS